MRGVAELSAESHEGKRRGVMANQTVVEPNLSLAQGPSERPWRHKNAVYNDNRLYNSELQQALGS